MNENVLLKNASLQSTDETNIEGSIVLDSDSGNVYLNSTSTGQKILIADSVQYLDTDQDRINISEPEDQVMYIVRSTQLIWIWYNSSWVNINAPLETYFDIDNVEIPVGTAGATFTDSRITYDCTASFVPIEALYDLATAEGVSITCTCSSGAVRVVSTCSYPLIGKIKIIKQ